MLSTASPWNSRNQWIAAGLTVLVVAVVLVFAQRSVEKTAANHDTAQQACNQLLADRGQAGTMSVLGEPSENRIDFQALSDSGSWTCFAEKSGDTWTYALSRD